MNWKTMKKEQTLPQSTKCLCYFSKRTKCLHTKWW